MVATRRARTLPMIRFMLGCGLAMGFAGYLGCEAPARDRSPSEERRASKSRSKPRENENAIRKTRRQRQASAAQKAQAKSDTRDRKASKKEPQPHAAGLVASQRQKDRSNKQSSNEKFSQLKAGDLLGKASKTQTAAATQKKDASPSPKTANPATRSSSRILKTETPITGLSFPRMTLAHGIVGREPRGIATQFRPKERVHLFIEAKNEGSRAQDLAIAWKSPDGSVHGDKTSLTIPKQTSRFRTWAYSRPFKSPGSYHVIVSDTQGRVLQQIAFQIVE